MGGPFSPTDFHGLVNNLLFCALGGVLGGGDGSEPFSHSELVTDMRELWGGVFSVASSSLLGEFGNRSMDRPRR